MGNDPPPERQVLNEVLLALQRDYGEAQHAASKAGGLPMLAGSVSYTMTVKASLHDGQLVIEECGAIELTLNGELALDDPWVGNEDPESL